MGETKRSEATERARERASEREKEREKKKKMNTLNRVESGGVSKEKGNGVSKDSKLVKQSSSNAAKSEKRRRNEIRMRIDQLRKMMPDSVRNKNVIEVLDDTILLINNMRAALESLQMSLNNQGSAAAASLNPTIGAQFLQSQQNIPLQPQANTIRLDQSLFSGIKPEQDMNSNLVTMIQQQRASPLGGLAGSSGSQQVSIVNQFLHHQQQQQQPSFQNPTGLLQFQGADDTSKITQFLADNAR